MTNTQNIKGLLGTNLGMTQVWDEDNKLIPVTVVKADPNVVTQLRSEETDGYTAVQIAYGQIDPRRVTKPLAGHFDKAGVTPRRHLVELRTADASEYTLGQELGADVFAAADPNVRGFTAAADGVLFGSLEAIGVDDPALDAEVIAVATLAPAGKRPMRAADWARGAGLAPDARFTSTPQDGASA